MSKRSGAIEKAWRERKREGAPHTCAYCGKPIWARGAEHGGKWYHRSCWKRYQVHKMRSKTATRGFYKKHRPPKQ